MADTDASDEDVLTDTEATDAKKTGAKKADVEKTDVEKSPEVDVEDESTRAAELTTSDADETASTEAESASDAPKLSEDADADDGDDEDISLEPDVEVKARPPWVGRAVKIAAAAAAVAIVAGAGFIAWKWNEQRDKDIASRDALTAAQQFAGVLTNVDSGKIDENFAKTMDGSTGEFKDMYSKSSAQLRQMLVDNKASAHGMVVESAVQSATANKVEVMLFIDQAVSNVSSPDAQLDRSRVKMTMEKVDGRWLASKIELP